MILGMSKIILLLLKYRYFFLFPVAVFEGPIISVLAGFLVSQQVFGFWMVIFVSTFLCFNVFVLSSLLSVCVQCA